MRGTLAMWECDCCGSVIHEEYPDYEHTHPWMFTMTKRPPICRCGGPPFLIAVTPRGYMVVWDEMFHVEHCQG